MARRSIFGIGGGPKTWQLGGRRARVDGAGIGTWEHGRQNVDFDESMDLVMGKKRRKGKKKTLAASNCQRLVAADRHQRALSGPEVV